MGADGIPAEVFKNSEVTKNLLFAFLEKVWKKESVPAELAVDICDAVQKRITR